jgi:hypothetical protein
MLSVVGHLLGWGAVFVLRFAALCVDFHSAFGRHKMGTQTVYRINNAIL